MGMALGDYLHTGRMSLLISHFDNEYAAFYRNDGEMNFTESRALRHCERHQRLCGMGRCLC